MAALTDLTAATAAGITAATALGGVLAATVSWRAALVLPTVAAVVLLCLLPGLPEPVRAPAGRRGLRVVLRQPWGRALLALSLVEGAVLLGLLTYLVPALESTGTSPTVAGLVVALYGVSLLLTSRLVKRAVDQTPPARLLEVGAGTLALAYVVLALSQSAGAVALGAVLIGAGWAPMHSTMQTWATEAVPAARATTVSLFAGALFLGSGVATAALAPMAGSDDWGRMFTGAAVVAAGFGVVAGLARRRFSPPAPVGT
jgi:predicted MFS family arabinose efflux permease